MCNIEEIFYLIRNINGFEEIITSGSKEDLEKIKSQYDFDRDYLQDEFSLNIILYYIVPKNEWDSQNCPFFPVDFP